MPHILVVDDDRGQRASMRRVLRRSGYRISTASNGREGLRCVLDLSPDLILLDVTMPIVSGHEFLRRLRRLERRRSAKSDTPVFSAPPVIFVTGRDLAHQRIDGLDAGAVDYITKPFDPNELRARIRRVLRDFGQAGSNDPFTLTHEHPTRSELYSEVERSTQLLHALAAELAHATDDEFSDFEDSFTDLLSTLKNTNGSLQGILNQGDGKQAA